MELSEHMECEQDPASQISGTDSFIRTDPQGHCKTHEMTFDVDAESGTGTKEMMNRKGPACSDFWFPSPGGIGREVRTQSLEEEKE
jgi:hypothetical protein